MHLRMRVRIHSMHLRMCLRTARQGDDPLAPAWLETLWGNGFSAFFAQSALTSHLSGPGRRARL